VVDGRDWDTRSVIQAFHRAFLGGDAEAMLALMPDSVEVCFLGQARLHAVEAVRAFFAFSADLLEELAFTIRRTIVDGGRAAVIWSEIARTRSGTPWENCGVDVFRVEDGMITVLHENNDVRLVHRSLPQQENS
jgi:ketosteroid isomerase-like protein